jgi:hypothetical protein
MISAALSTKKGAAPETGHRDFGFPEAITN